MSGDRKPIRVVLVDDDPAMLGAVKPKLRSRAEIEVVATGSNGRDALELLILTSEESQDIAKQAIRAGAREFCSSADRPGDRGCLSGTVRETGASFHGACALHGTAGRVWHGSGFRP